MRITFTYENDDGEEIVALLPATHDVCSMCEGHGTHLTRSIGEHAYTSEEFYEAFSEEEDREQYFTHGGIYDVVCEECAGKRVVVVVDEGACVSTEEKALLALYNEQEDQRARWDAEDRATYRMETGYRE